MNHAAVQAVQQVRDVTSGQIDDAERERLLSGGRHAFAHGALGPLRVAIVSGCERARVGRGVVENFFADFPAG
jgi:hypothetical protein